MYAVVFSSQKLWGAAPHQLVSRIATHYVDHYSLLLLFIDSQLQTGVTFLLHQCGGEKYSSAPRPLDICSRFTPSM